jgi:hypothetical protein
VAKSGRLTERRRIQYNYRPHTSPNRPRRVWGPFLLLVLYPASWSDFYTAMVVCFKLGLMVKSVVSVPGPLSAHSFTYRSQYLRITLNYVTLSFFIFSFLHCFTQGILQSFLYTADDTWGSITSHIVSRADINPTVFPQFTGRRGNYSLELCDEVPVVGGEPHPCVPFFTAGQPEPITIPHRYLPHGAHAPDPDASFVRQPFISFIPVLLNLFFGTVSQCFRSIERGEFLSGNRYNPSPLTFPQTSSTWLVDSRSIHIDSQTRSDGLSDIIVTSGDGRTSLTLNPVCTYTLLYPAAR